MLGFAPLSTLLFGATPAPPGPYVRPAAASADISFDGVAYTSPASTAADLTFAPVTARVATAIPPVASFGVPIAAYARTATATGLEPATNVPTPGHCLTQPTSGISTTSFGVGFGANYQRPVGFSTTEIGAARIFPYIPPPWNKSTQIGAPRLFPFHVAPWPVSTQFGGVGGHQFWRAPTMAVVTRLGTPTTPTNRTGTASGFIAVQIGRPLATRYRPPNTDIICLAGGFKPTIIGTPAAQWDQSGQAQTIEPTVQFGDPGAFTTYHAEGTAPSVQFGAPSTRTTHRVSGFKPVALGLAGAILTQHATGTAPKARFGAPKTFRLNWYEVRGFCPFRAGTPRGYQRNNRRADGFSPVQFGMAAAFHAHRTTSVPPVARLGRPLLKRITQC